MEYREADFDFDIRHFAVSYKLTGAVFRFDGYPDPVAGTQVRVSDKAFKRAAEIFAKYPIAAS